ncbi:unnamed protein product, partial [Pocillopora meandrina]
EKTSAELVEDARRKLDLAKRNVQDLQERVKYKSKCYTVSELPENGIRMETGLPTKEVFKIVVKSVTFEDQIFIALMKVRKNDTNHHLVQLFNCSVATIRHIITTFIHVLHSIFFHDIMTSIPTQETT